MFICDKCGACCQSLNFSDLYAEYDRGDGICLFYDATSRLCTIYDTRPMICNVDKMYEVSFSNKMTKEEYYQLNYQACKKIRREQGEN